MSRSDFRGVRRGGVRFAGGVRGNNISGVRSSGVRGRNVKGVRSSGVSVDVSRSGGGGGGVSRSISSVSSVSVNVSRSISSVSISISSVSMSFSSVSMSVSSVSSSVSVSVSAVGGVASGGRRPSKVGLRDVVADPGHHRGVLRGGRCLGGHNPHRRLPT